VLLALATVATELLSICIILAENGDQRV
jgi:hypothetical protein